MQEIKNGIDRTHLKFLNVLAGIVAFSVNLIEVAAVNPFNVANSSVVNATLEMMFVN